MQYVRLCPSPYHSAISLKGGILIKMGEFLIHIQERVEESGCAFTVQNDMN